MSEPSPKFQWFHWHIVLPHLSLTTQFIEALLKMPDQVNRPHLIVVSSLIDGRSTSRRLLHIGYGRHFAGIGNAVKIPALPLVIADFSELVIHHLSGIGNPRLPENPVDMSDTNA